MGLVKVRNPTPSQPGSSLRPSSSPIRGNYRQNLIECLKGEIAVILLDYQRR
jgi:hypothetical protein